MKVYAGVDIGGTRIKLGIMDEEGQIKVRKLVDTPKEYDALVAVIDTFLKESEYDICGLGVSIPGIVTSEGYMQTSGAIKCCLHRNMQEEFAKHFHMPVAIENDSKCAAAGETWLGAAQSLQNFVCLTLGTAVGGAVYINGTLLRGLGGLAGEFGIALAGLEKDVYNEQSFSYHAATVAGLCRNYSYRVHERVLDAREIYRRSAQGDVAASECIQDFYHACATLCINVAVAIGPEVILIGGGISQNEQAIQGIKDAYRRMCQEYHVLSMVQMPELKPCELKNDAGMIGAIVPLIQHHE